MRTIFNINGFDVNNMIDYIKSSGINLPYLQVTNGVLGNETIMILASFDPKSEWNHGYVENSQYFRMMIESNGVMEVFTQSLHQRNIRKSYDTRLKTKFRKSTVKDKESVIKKLNEYIEKVRKEWGE